MRTIDVRDFLRGLQGLPVLLDLERLTAADQIRFSTRPVYAELLNLDPGDLNHDEREVIVRHGKGEKGRLPLTRSAYESVMGYLERASPSGASNPDSAVAFFLSSRGRRMSDVTLADVLRKARGEAGTKKLVKCHLFRRAFATHLLKAGASIRHKQVAARPQRPEHDSALPQDRHPGVEARNPPQAPARKDRRTTPEEALALCKRDLTAPAALDTHRAVLGVARRFLVTLGKPVVEVTQSDVREFLATESRRDLAKTTLAGDRREAQDLLRDARLVGGRLGPDRGFSTRGGGHPPQLMLSPEGLTKLLVAAITPRPWGRSRLT